MARVLLLGSDTPHTGWLGGWVLRASHLTSSSAGTHTSAPLRTPKAQANNDKRKQRATGCAARAVQVRARAVGLRGAPTLTLAALRAALPQRPRTRAACGDVAAAVARARLGSGSTARSRSHRPPRIPPPGGEAAAGTGEAGPARSLPLRGPRAPHAGERRVRGAPRTRAPPGSGGGLWGGGRPDRPLSLVHCGLRAAPAPPPAPRPAPAPSLPPRPRALPARCSPRSAPFKRPLRMGREDNLKSSCH